jgi:hypothetical protein
MHRLLCIVGAECYWSVHCVGVQRSSSKQQAAATHSQPPRPGLRPPRRARTSCPGRRARQSRRLARPTRPLQRASSRVLQPCACVSPPAGVGRQRGGGGGGVRASWRCRGSVSRTGAGGEARRAPPSSPAPRRCPPPPRCSQRRSDSRARCQTRCPSPAGPRRPRRAGRPSPAVWHSGSTVFASACCCSFVSSEVLKFSFSADSASACWIFQGHILYRNFHITLPLI